MFLARQVAKHGNQLEIQPRMFDRMMACVTESMNDSSHEERQQVSYCEIAAVVANAFFLGVS